MSDVGGFPRAAYLYYFIGYIGSAAADSLLKAAVVIAVAVTIRGAIVGMHSPFTISDYESEH
ncbi:MAG: hypothetical protein ACFB4I_01685 [Cyanophyceae cyanobacterium]